MSVDTKLTDLLSKGESTTKLLVVMASSIQGSTPAATMNPLLLSLACSGSWQDLELLLNNGSGPSVRYDQEFLDLLTAYSSDGCINRGTSTQQGSDDVEASLNTKLSAASLLEGVTAAGGTALHMVAMYGDSDGFLRSAGIIHGKAKHLLFVQNNNGDTPLHCASRAGMSPMVRHLIGLARDTTSASRVKELLEMENEHQETASGTTI